MSKCSIALLLFVLQQANAARHRSLDFEEREELPSLIRAPADAGISCANLHNSGSFSTVEISIGTPPQKMSLVADTGSDVLLVEDCVCEEIPPEVLGSCKKDGKCFRGKNKSSSFHISDHPKQETITYGSGPIDTVVATDIVRLGDTNATMNNSLLLIVRNRLEGGLQLDGILGLGLPHSSKSMSSERSFLDQAEVDRFSMCFHGDGKTGVLRLGSGIAMEKPLGGVGTQHWGVDFRGISVGKVGGDAEVQFCKGLSQQQKDDGQKTPCAAVVDSGTTLILAPKEHLVKLIAQICDMWPQCSGKHQSLLELEGEQTGEQLALSKSRMFYELAAGCALDSMPTLHFHVRGALGLQDTLELAPDDYMIETSVHLGGALNGKPSLLQKTCQPAFDVHDFNTKVNGPVWLFGTPFFYKYNIAYDRKLTPPALAFGRKGCGSCSGGSQLFAQRGQKRRSLNSAPRVSYINVTLPL